MTDIHTLSDSELNELIAKAKGWTHISGCQVCGQKHWYDPYNYMQSVCPDFTHDSGLAMALLEEMIAEMDLTVITVFLDNINHFREEVSITKLPIKRLEINLHQSDNLLRKISEAYAEWHGLSKSATSGVTE